MRFMAPAGLAATALAAACAPPEEDPAAQSVGQAIGPNVVVVVVDDLRWDELGIAGHAYLETPRIDQLAREGTRFANAFHAVPLCSPNRASILTGQYPSRHGIIDNVARNRMSHRLQTFPQALQEHGYATAFYGKWHMGNDPTPRPGFDDWAAIPGQGRTMNPELFEDGRIHEVPGYITDVLTDRAVAFIQEERESPFFIYIGHKAVHPDAVQLDDGSVDPTVPSEYVPAPRHRGRYDDDVFPRRPNVASSLEELSSTPALQRAVANRIADRESRAFGSVEIQGTSETTIRRRAEMMLAVDEGLGRIVDALDAEGVLDNTLILFTSDNGFFYGEHGLSVERRMPYEESIRTPMIVRYPPLAGRNVERNEIVASIDIAPTMLDIAGVPIGEHIQGRSFAPLLQGLSAGWRESLLIEFYTYENPFSWLVDMDYKAIRTQRYKYIHWMQHPDENELYDLESDPYEVQNLINDPMMTGTLADLRRQLALAVVDAIGLTP